MCNTLRAIADLGLTVVAVIHQPRNEIFTQFDDLLLLAPGGVTAFIGPRSGAIPYFESIAYEFTSGNNPADLLLDFVAGRDFHRILASGRYRASDDHSLMDKELSTASLPTDSLDDNQRTGLLGSFSKRSTSEAQASAHHGDLPECSRFFAEQWTKACSKDATSPRSPRLQDALISVPASAAPLSPIAAKMGGAAVATIASGPHTGVGSIQQGQHGQNGHADGSPLSPNTRPDLDAIISKRGASFLYQVYLCHNRSVIQQYRRIGGYALEMGVGLLAGGMMGAAASPLDGLYIGILRPPYTLISPAPLESICPSMGFYVVLAVGIAGSPAGVLTFGEEKHVYYREAAAGHNTLAYYIGKSLATVYRFSLGSLHFASIFMLLAKPATPFGTLFLEIWVMFFCVYGLAAIMSMVVKRENAALLAVIVSLAFGCLCGYGPSLNQFHDWHLDFIPAISYARWGVEAWFTTETASYRDHYMVAEVSAPLFGYTLDRFAEDIGICVALGVAYRIIAFVLLIAIGRNKQR